MPGTTNRGNPEWLIRKLRAAAFRSHFRLFIGDQGHRKTVPWWYTTPIILEVTEWIYKGRLEPGTYTPEELTKEISKMEMSNNVPFSVEAQGMSYTEGPKNDPVKVFNHIAGEVPMRLKGSGATMVKTEIDGLPIMKLEKGIRLAGCQFEGREEITKTIQIGDVLTLLREPSNEYDKNAIMVYTKDVRHIGYIPSQLAGVMSPDMRAGFRPFGLVKDFREYKGVTYPVIEIFEYI